MTRRVLGKRGRVTAASPTPDPAEEATKRSQDRRDGAWIIRSLNQSLLPDTAWGDCGNPVGGRVAIKRLEGDRGTMQPSTIATCKSPWACLSCAGKIRAHRAIETDQLAKAHLAAGGGLTFITITFPHVMSDSLKASLKTVNKGWRSLISGAGYKGKETAKGEYIGGAKQRWGILGNIRAIEITDGLVHGWHPHLHVLCFHHRQLSPEDGSLQEFRAWWSDRWARWVKRTLGRDIHTERGVDAVPVRDAAGLGEYVSKIHFELVRSDLKKDAADRVARRGRSLSTLPRPATVGTWLGGSSTATPPRASGSSRASQPSARSTSSKPKTSPTKRPPPKPKMAPWSPSSTVDSGEPPAANTADP